MRFRSRLGTSLALVILWACLPLSHVRAGQPDPPPGVDVEVAVKAVLGPGQTRPLDPGAQLHSGDKFIVTLDAPRAVHVYLGYKSAQGEISPLGSAVVTPGQEAVLPVGGKSFTVDERVGTDNLVLAAAEHALTDGEQTRQLLFAAEQPPPPPPPPGPITGKDRPGPLPAQIWTRAHAAHGKVALLRFPLSHLPR